MSCWTHASVSLSLLLFFTTGASVSSTLLRLPPSNSSTSLTSARSSLWTGWGLSLARTWAGTNKWARVVINWSLEQSGPHRRPPLLIILCIKTPFLPRSIWYLYCHIRLQWTQSHVVIWAVTHTSSLLTICRSYMQWNILQASRRLRCFPSTPKLHFLVCRTRVPIFSSCLRLGHSPW